MIFKDILKNSSLNAEEKSFREYMLQLNQQYNKELTYQVKVLITTYGTGEIKQTLIREICKKPSLWQKLLNALR